MNMTLKKQLSIMAAIAIIAVVVLALVSYLMAANSAIGSKVHRDISQANELRADILPPPIFMLEIMMNLNQLGIASASERKASVRELKHLIEQYNSRVAYWKNNASVAPEVKQFVMEKLDPQAQEFIGHINDDVFTAVTAGDDAVLLAELQNIAMLYTEHKELVKELVVIAERIAAEKTTAGSAAVGFYQALLYVVALIAIISVVFCSLFFSRKILLGLGADPSELQQLASQVAAGNVNVSLPNITDQQSVLAAMAAMLASIKQGLATAQDNVRIKQALDATSSNVMIADTARTIIYMNNAVEKMLREAESDLRKALPHFAVDKVIGSNMDIFHKNPAHQSALLANLTSTYTGNIVVAGRSYRLIASPIFAADGTRMGSVVEWIDRTKEVAAEHEMSRILGALETTTTNVMIADPGRKIIYMNKSVETMLRVAETDIRSVLPHFSVDKIIGSNMDIFHKNPAHQMKLLENLTAAYTGNIVVGKRHFRLVANPIFAKNGDRLGSVVEWLDRTQEVSVESEVSKLVEAAAAGNFSQRIVIEGKEGFFLKLAEGLNALVTTADKGLNDVARVLGAIAKGDLTEKITGDYFGTFGELKNYCNETTNSLTAMLSDIRIAAETIFTASSEIAQGNADLSSRTEQQAANLEETASSMEELTSTVKLNADNAKQANVLAEQASTVASDGGSLIQQVVTTMNDINQSSQKIADIIGVIDGIAFQTNILALNAAVEAARAGDQGRGFAVVASEVRTLAQRSANAAKDIKGLISDSVNKIESGNALVGKSGDTMKEIVTAIKRVNDIMAEIAAASAEQSTGIEEVSTAVSQMDEMTQQNASLVEEAAAAAESLQSQADQLTRNVAQFRLSTESIPMQASASRLGAAKTKVAKPVAATKKLNPPKAAQEDEWEEF